MLFEIRDTQMLRLGLLLICWIVTTLPAAAAPEPTLPSLEPHIIVLPGVEGPSPCSRGIVSGLRQTHPNATYEVFDWTTGHVYRMLYHARGWDRNQAVAALLADHIVTLQNQEPYRPIILVGHSGGGAMAVLALEQLPPGYRIHQAILLAPYISPVRSLATSLDRTLQGIDVFHSPFDFIVLGAATMTVGTLDRVRLPAAGMVGFHTPQGLDEGSQFLYAAKLHQHGYEPAMFLTGHYGGHFTCTLPEFVNRYVSPVIR
jgi:pimeloyl-ACP methyl ester carboxylesterase